jgi:hypothetical protein
VKNPLFGGSKRGFSGVRKGGFLRRGGGEGGFTRVTLLNYARNLAKFGENWGALVGRLVRGVLNEDTAGKVERKSFQKYPIDAGARIWYNMRRFLLRGDIAQLVERLNGIEKVRGSTPLISTILF